MAKRRRHRFWSTLLCVLIVGAFLASLPGVEPMRRQVSIGLHKASWNILQHPRVVETVVDENWRYPEWYSHWLRFHNSSLESMGECQRIFIPITKSDADLLNAGVRLNRVPRGVRRIDWIKQEDGSYTFSALVSRDYLPDWQTYAMAIRNGERKIVGE